MKTIIFDRHIELGGKMTDFGGWEMPLWYKKGQSAEHHATRNKVGLFDICHMGEFAITGSSSEAFFSNLLTNDVKGMKDGQAMYNFMLNEAGGVIDDCILYKFDTEKWMLVVNAGNIAEDFEWLTKHADENTTVIDNSDTTAKLDLQGPNAPKLMKKIAGEESIKGLGFFKFRDNIDMNGVKVLLSRTGYTGEIGFELYCDTKDAIKLWDMLLKEGEELEIEPCGLGARDSLRTEAGLPLHGHEVAPDFAAVGNPWNFVYEWDNHDFIGKEVLNKVKEDGIKTFVIPFMMDGRSKAMPGWNVLENGEIIGTVVSGVISPTLENRPIGFLKIDRKLEEGTELTFNQDGKKRILEGKISKSPFVKPTSRKKMVRFL